jgi:hypothetical protein
VATPQVSENPEVQQNYLAGLALGAAVAQTVSGLWDATAPLESAEAMARFANGLLIVGEQFGGVAASLGEDYYRGARREAGITTTIKLPEPVLPTRAEIDADIAWATRERAKLADDLDATYAAVLADMQAETEKAVLDVMRTRVVQAVEGDDTALGFRRVCRPGACYWCISLAIRTTTRDGNERNYGVYKTRASAGQLPAGASELNRFHTKCKCGIEPVWSPADTIPDWLGDMEQLYSDSTQESAKGESLNDFRKALTAHRNGEERPEPVAPVSLPTSNPAAAQIAAILDRLAEAMAA